MATIPRPNSSSHGKRRRHLPFVALLCLLLVASCSDILGPTGDAAAEPDEWIVFVSDRASETGEIDIFRVNPDGSEVVNLTSHPTQTYSDLGLSPDHSTLLFRSTRSGCYEIWSMPLETLEPLQLTGPNEGCNTRPRWSSDGSMIGFTSSRDGRWEVYVMEADGSAPRNVSNNGGVEGLSTNMMHGWSADGGVVFFHSVPGEPYNTLVVDSDGTGLEPLFEEVDGTFYPHWSPDGSQAIVAKEVDGVSQLHVMNGDRTEVRTVPAGAGLLLAPGRSPWSPDGERIIASDSDYFYVMNADGSDLAQVTEIEGYSFFKGWSPDGTRIAFSSDRAGTWDIYVVNIDGTGLQRITDGSGNDRNAVWVPRQ